MPDDERVADESDDILDALRHVDPAPAEVRETHIGAALRAYDAAGARRGSRVLSLAAALLVVFGLGSVAGWAVRNNNSPATAQPTARTVGSPEIPCHQLFPSINFIGIATPSTGDVAVFLDTRSTPEAVVLVSPTTCQVVVRYDLAPPITTG